MCNVWVLGKGILCTSLDLKGIYICEYISMHILLLGNNTSRTCRISCCRWRSALRHGRLMCDHAGPLTSLSALQTSLIARAAEQARQQMPGLGLKITGGHLRLAGLKLPGQHLRVPLASLLLQRVLLKQIRRTNPGVTCSAGSATVGSRTTLAVVTSTNVVCTV